jgi:hypothetical protein
MESGLMIRLTGKLLTLPRALAALCLLLGVVYSGFAATNDHTDPEFSEMAASRFTASDDDTFYIHHEITSGNAMGLFAYTNGFLGNNFYTRAASLEFPNGSGQEHLVRGGLWIGGLYSEDGSFANAETLVTTSTIDGYSGGESDTESEFVPSPIGFIRRSTVFSDPFWTPAAESEQDLICQFKDDHNRGGPLHKPLHIRVVQSIYQFSFEPFDAIIFIDYSIINDDPLNPIFDLYVGLYKEFASGWKGGHEEWPPSGWFSRKDIGYYPDSLRLEVERHYNLDEGNCPSWIGCALLGTRPDSILTKNVSFNWWEWDPNGSFEDTPITDPERYDKLSNGDSDNTASVEAPNSDPVTLLSVGPLGSEPFTGPDGLEHQVLWPGDTVSVVFAFVGGAPAPSEDPPRNAEEDIRFNTSWAQTYFDLGGDIPLPPPSPQLYVETSHGALDLWWDGSPEEFVDPKSKEKDFEGYRVLISEVGKSEGYNTVGEYDIIDTLSYNTGLDAITADEPLVIGEGDDAVTYQYHQQIHDVRDGFKYWIAVTSFDTGANDIEPLESGLSQNRVYTIPGAKREETPEKKVIVFPNPYHGDAAWDEALDRDRYLWFAGLPTHCRLRIYNLAGDLIREINFDGDTYGATDVRGIYDPTDTWNPSREVPVMSGGIAAWDLTTREDQAAASGLYIFSVEDLDSGEVERGKFLIIK